jgi:uncharacterized membrane protein
MLITTAQIVWALIGLFFGLLLAAPHSWFPTRTRGTQGAFVCVVIGSLFGMKASYEAAALFASFAVVIVVVALLQHAMYIAEQPRQTPVKQKGRHIL